MKVFLVYSGICYQYTLVSITKRQPKNTSNKLCNMNHLKKFMLAAYSSNCLRTEECLHTVYKCIYAHIYRYNWKATRTKLPRENDKGNFMCLAVYKNNACISKHPACSR